MTTDIRLKGGRCEATPKRVLRSGTFRDYVGLSTRPELAADLTEMIDCLTQGRLIPDRFYRAGIDRDDDRLLEDRGIKHLHLGGPKSDVLVFLIEYADRVTLLEINDHKHFRTDPVGTLLFGLYNSYVERDERHHLEQRRLEIERRKGVLRTSLKPRRRR